MENNAVLYAEKHGITNYRVNGNQMTHVFQTYEGKWSLYECTVDLEQMKEVKRVKLY